MRDQLNRNGRKVLSLFVTVGYPIIETTVPLVVALANAGANVIELGIPFSDPIADGPTIQLSSDVALHNGVTVQKTFEMARQIRKQHAVPLVLMGYANPIFRYGLPKFMQECSDCGIDGVIIPDLPMEESEEYRTLAGQNNVAAIFLAAPTTSDERLIELDNCSTGFLYCVSITGVTGERAELATQADDFLKRARSHVKKNPLLVGFGIATPEDARRVAIHADGVIIGSALMKILQSSDQKTAIPKAVEFVRTIRVALDA